MNTKSENNTNFVIKKITEIEYTMSNLYIKIETINENLESLNKRIESLETKVEKILQDIDPNKERDPYDAYIAMH